MSYHYRLFPSQGYSQHMMAKILELNQATVNRVIKRNSEK